MKNMTIGDRIKLRREELGLTQQELADRLGYKSKTSINKIELNIQNLTQSKIKAIADALETTPAYIMGWDINDSDQGGYYTNKETAEIAQKVYDDPDLRMLFDAAQDVKPEAIRQAAEMLKLFKNTNKD